MEMDDEAVAPRAELESARTTGPALCSNRRSRTSVKKTLLRRRREATCLSDGDKVSKMPKLHANGPCLVGMPPNLQSLSPKRQTNLCSLSSRRLPSLKAVHQHAILSAHIETASGA